MLFFHSLFHRKASIFYNNFFFNYIHTYTDQSRSQTPTQKRGESLERGEIKKKKKEKKKKKKKKNQKKKKKKEKEKFLCGVWYVSIYEWGNLTEISSPFQSNAPSSILLQK
jgi:hypothetical protein